MSAKKRVLIIGIDGFTWRLARCFMEKGVIPNLEKLVRTGCHGNLKSTIPFETGPAWSSFQTGCWPGKTGIFAFHGYDRKTRKVHLNSFADIAVPSLWELADRAGRRIVSLNMPVTSPPPKVNGVIIPGLLCPKLSPQMVCPSEAYDKYIKPHKDYLIVNNCFRDTVKEFTQQSIVTERVRTQVALELINKEEWDVFYVQIQSSDLMQHRLWWALEPTAKGFDPRMNSDALEFYRFCDQAIGKITASAGPEVLTLVVSDHGFCGLKCSVSINVWLKQHGYLNLLSGQSENKWILAKKKIPILKSLAKLYGNVRQKMGRRGKNIFLGEQDLFHMRQLIDFDKTQAFCLGGMSGLLYINGTTRQRETLSAQIRDELLDHLGPKSPDPVISGITSGMQTYNHIEQTDALPDMVVEYREGVVSVISPFGDTVVKTSGSNGRQCGTHDPNGILVANGPGIRSGIKLNGDIVDIMPTVLAFLGIAIPRHIDGKVLNEAFGELLEVEYEDSIVGNCKSSQYTNEEQAEVERQLSGLGYL